MSVSTSCFHCEEPIPKGTNFKLELMGSQRSFCCPGCQEVAKAVIDNGLEDYYRLRSEPAEKVSYEDDLIDKLALYDNPVLRDELVIDDGDLSTIQLTIGGIKCAACAWLIEKQCLQLPGVQRIGVDVSANRATVEWNNQNAKLSDILKCIDTIGYRAAPFHADSNEQQFKNESKQFLKKLGLSGLLTMQVMMFAFGLYFGVFGDIDTQTQSFFHWVSMLLSVPVVFYSGSEFFSRALRALTIQEVNMDVPISIAIIIIFSSSCWATITGHGTVYFESVCMFIFLLLISRYLELQSRRKAATITANTNQHIPVMARLIKAGHEQQALARALKPGDLVRVKTGETIPVDAQVVNGISEVDESMLSGEFRPVLKQVNDRVFGGTINQSSVLELKVEKSLQHSIVQEISRLQELALSQKPPIAILVDKIAKYFIYIVLFLSAGTFLFWSAQENQNAMLFAVSVLVATCPCALGLATPTALTAAMAKLKQFNIILKSADFLENLSEIDTVVFDKTGTLTEGKFSIAEWINHSHMDEQQVLLIAASLETHSEHPIARAFTSDTLLPFGKVKVVVGSGIEGVLDGKHYKIGSQQYTGVENLAQSSTSNVFMSANNQLIAEFSLQDQLASGVNTFIESISHLQQVILSGDARNNVKSIAEQLHIQQWQARCRPEDKLEFIKNLQSSGKRVLMIGDGINDGPVLAQADISIAVNNATDLAKNAADVLMLRENIGALKILFSIAEKTRSTIRTNILWALGYNTCVLPLAMAGWLTPWMAVIGMSLSSIIVVFNSTRLLSQNNEGKLENNGIYTAVEAK